MENFNPNNHKWGGSGIERVVYDFICAHLAPGSTVIELGAGHVSTPALASRFNLYSVEHNPAYVGLYPNTTYIHAPVINGWYSSMVLAAKLPPKPEQALVLVDGVGRQFTAQHMYLFNTQAMFIVHDTYREVEMFTANELAKAVGRHAQFHYTGDFWAVI